MQASQNAINLIKEFEGFSPKVYLCPAGKPTIGYGHVVREGEIFTTINQTQGEILLKRDLRMAEKTIDSSLSCDLTQNEFDALCSLIFNIGGNNFRKSTVAKLLNENNYMDGADAILMWNKVTNPKTGEKEISKGLERRREAERNLFLRDDA